ncbi:MAG TPA: dihydrolipoamide acetyltransferase family protein [Bryobacteraceae bacterium]|jgi:pyruvate dehydrogenase E2 component (dihydrolipoamide acetyltransferase)|nr:dihydrolipoamide acetyltransferase family protein [Bryobacteraceae bacterium]
MATPVEVPKLGNTVEECIVSRWLKGKGDAVSAGDVVAEIETDKATFEVTAPVSGTVIATFFDEGALVPVFTKLFVIGEPGETVEPNEADPRPAQPQVTASEVTPPTEISTGGTTAGATNLAATTASFSPRARRFAEEHRFYPPAVNGSGPGGRILEEDLRELYYSREGATRRPRADEGVRPTKISESPVVGRTTWSAADPLVGHRPQAEAAPRASIREKIARRMRESLASTAQYTLNASADAGGLLTLRARIKASTGVPDINLNHLVTFCTIRALLEVPALNAEFIDGKIRNHSEVHIGFACDTPRGLLVPVIRNAHELAIGDLASTMKSLTAQAVQGSISPDSLSGATFTVSNLGGLGIESFTPLLNPPQVAILGVGAIQLKAVRKQGKVEFTDAIGLSLTCDHQVIDGAPGARFLQIVKEKIENVESLCTI